MLDQQPIELQQFLKIALSYLLSRVAQTDDFAEIPEIKTLLNARLPALAVDKGGMPPIDAGIDDRPGNRATINLEKKSCGVSFDRRDRFDERRRRRTIERYLPGNRVARHIFVLHVFRNLLEKCAQRRPR